MEKSWLPAGTLSKEEKQTNENRGRRPWHVSRPMSHQRVTEAGRDGALGDGATCLFSVDEGEAGQAHIPAQAPNPTELSRNLWGLVNSTPETRRGTEEGDTVTAFWKACPSVAGAEGAHQRSESPGAATEIPQTGS